MSSMAIASDPLTLTRHLLATQDPKRNGAGFPMLMASIQLACKTISQAVRKAGIIGVLGLAGSTNSTGDDVKKLDLLSNDVFINALKFSRELCVLVSEELEDPLIIEEAIQGIYCVATDPLDGSSNIDCNVSTGTIFGIYKRKPDGEKPFKLSRSKVDNYVSCKRCFYIDRRLGVGHPPGFPFNINSAVDELLKKEFDQYREAGKPHPYMETVDRNLIPYKDGQNF